MKKVVGFTFALILSSTLAFAGSSWSYDGETGPEHWGELSPDYAMCSRGMSQSPVNISATTTVESALALLRFNYSDGGAEFTNNGHTVQVNYQEGSSLTVNNQAYELKQFHFHSPSENAVDGQLYPLEVHLVHANAEGQLAVVGIFFEEGAANATLDEFWNQMPLAAGETVTLSDAVNVKDLLPYNRSYYRFSGSLTTPPCSEGVTWLVIKEPVTVSEEQLARFTQAVGPISNRPVQPLNARVVMQ